MTTNEVSRHRLHQCTLAICSDSSAALAELLASKIILLLQRLSVSSTDDGIDKEKHCESTLIPESTMIILSISLFFFRSINDDDHLHHDDDGMAILVGTRTIVVIFFSSI